MKVSEKIRDYFATRGVGFYLTLPALLFAVLALCLYVKTGVTEFNPKLNDTAIVCLAVAMGMAVLGMVCESLPFGWAEEIVKPVRYIGFLVALYGLMQFVLSQVTYIANVFVAIDGNTFTAGFICTFLFFDLSWICMLVAACLSNIRPWAKRDKILTINEEGAEDER